MKNIKNILVTDYLSINTDTITIEQFLKLIEKEIKEIPNITHIKTDEEALSDWTNTMKRRVLNAVIAKLRAKSKIDLEEKFASVLFACDHHDRKYLREVIYIADVLQITDKNFI